MGQRLRRTAAVLGSSVLLAAPLAAGQGVAAPPAVSEVGPIPGAVRDRLAMDAFYTQGVSVGGFWVVASDGVQTAALREAAYVVGSMLAERPEVLAAMDEAGCRLAVMAWDEFTTDLPEHADLEPADYWDRRARGLGWTRDRPIVSCAEENVLAYPGDPYATESILVHEFAHAIHRPGLSAVDEAFDARLRAAYDAAMAAGLWEGKYAASNHSEYWAEAVQSWFGTNREDDRDHNHVNTRAELIAYDPAVAALCESVFGEANDWRYVRPDRREEGDASRMHLHDYDPATAPRFEWRGVEE